MKNLKRILLVENDPKDIELILTSSRESLDLQACYRLGVNAYVVKPVRFIEFVDAVKQTGMFWAPVNQPPPDPRPGK